MERSRSPIEQMDLRRLAVAAGAPGLLVELSEIEIEMVEHDVGYVGKIDALAEGRGRDHDAQETLAEETLDFESLAVRHAAVIEGDLVAELLAQRSRNLGDLRTRVAVDDALLARPLRPAAPKSSMR